LFFTALVFKLQSMKPSNTKNIFLIVTAVVIVSGFFVYKHVTKSQIKNVVLISMDTTRADNLSCYGVYKNATPRIDELASQGILFKNTYSPIPLTLPAHSTMLTGMFPPRHGVHDNSSYKLNEKYETLAELLKAKGFTTAAFISAFIIDAQFGLDQGFDLYDDKFEQELENSAISQRRGGETTEHALKWLNENKDDPFFMFVHYYDPHMPYDPPEPYKTMITHPYFAEIAYTDHCIGLVIDELKKLGLYDSTLIIVTGDHGEMLGEHDEQTHGYFIYNGNIKVPLIFKIPGKTDSAMIEGAVGIVDITPTICSLLGIDSPEMVQGKDLSTYFGDDSSGKPSERFLFSECMTPTKYGGNSLLGVITDKFKYIQTTRPELYDLVNDPKESKDLIAQMPQQARILQDKLKQILEESVVDNTDSHLELDTEAREKLETLGYVAGDVEEEFSFDQDKTDPKDLIDYHRDMSQIQGMIQKEEFDLAEKVCERLIAENNTETIGKLYHFMVMITKKKENFQKASDYLDKLAVLNPDKATICIDHAGVLLEMGKPQRVPELLNKAYSLQPDNPVICASIAKIFYDAKMLRKAIEYCHKALDTDPEFIPARISLADTLLKTNQLKLAVEQYYKVNEAVPDNLEALNTLAWIQATYRDKGLYNPKEALKLALQACQMTENKIADPLDTLAAAYAANSQFKKAIENAEKALKLAKENELTSLVERISNRLKLYRSGRAYYSQ